ncbi:hypothetical protein ACFE04_013769 [Oxalis oulophora]
MFCVKTLAFVTILVLIHPLTCSCDLLSSLTPLLAPVFDDVCKEVNCGKGKCEPNKNSSFLFECQCEEGWKQFYSDFKFLPCIVPNCSVNDSCTKTGPGSGSAPPVPHKGSTKDDNFFSDPCHWSKCGGNGSCNKTSAFTYDCLCEDGGTDNPCVSVGITFPNSTTASSPPALADASDQNVNNQGYSGVQINHLLLLVLLLMIFLTIY